MAASFTLEEKRFVLAEMIKCSTVDIERLARFVELHVLDPKWMTMQIPLGRNLEQCMHVASLLSTAPSHRPAMSQNDHLTNNGMSQPRQIAPRTSPSGQTPGPMPTSPVNIPPWQPADGVEDRRPLPYEVPSAQPPRKRGRPSRVDRQATMPPRLAAIAPKPPQSAPGPNTPRPILPATQRQVDARNSQPPPPSQVPPPLDSPPGRKKRRTAAGAVSVSTPPPAPALASAPSPLPVVPAATITPPASLDHGKRPRASSETDSTTVREMGQMQSPRPMPLEPEPRHHSLMPVASAPPPSQIKA
ncbi:hypothetical protein TARUN_9173 [Trichoderma arundinaceum]|uniref:Uncharacterized protein n=1 Tax=Trichoderma arundinaceum TaxID=490622 RepID=A0A395NAZ7_TRIAR|nr:hypothetical protein TARUN_9173 [Trichoderma arundinaceum]